MTTWQPEDAHSLTEAIRRLEKELPGWWWRVGACHVSADATVGPSSTGPDAHLLEHREFDEGIDCDLRQPASVGDALWTATSYAIKLKKKFEAAL